MEEVLVRGIAYDEKEAKITITGVPDKPGVAAQIFGGLSDAHINVDMIIQNASVGGYTDMSFTVSETDLKRVQECVERQKERIGAKAVISDTDIAKVSIIGVGMRSHPGVAAKMFKTLGDNGINIEMISTSEIRISCVIRAERLQEAIEALHRAFELEMGK